MEDFIYRYQVALILIGLDIIGWLLNKGFEAVKDILIEIRLDLKSEKEERQTLRAEFEAHKAACEARRAADPHLHYRMSDNGHGG